MTQAEAWMLAYLIVWTVAGHIALMDYLRWRRRARRRSIRGQKAAGTRRRKARANPTPPRPRPKKKKPMPADRMVTTESAWFELEEEEDEPDYNEVDLSQWHPRVRRFDGTALEYSHRDDPKGSV